METISNDSASAWCCVYSIVTAPAQQYATKPSVYTALFFNSKDFQSDSNLASSHTNLWTVLRHGTSTTVLEVVGL